MPHGTLGEAVVADITVEPQKTDLLGVAKVVRSIIKWAWMLDAGVGSSTPQQLAVGITLATIDALSGLVLPDPLGDLQQGWYYWDAKGHVFGNDTGENVEWEIDLRTSRVVRGGFRLVLISESPSSNDVNTTLFVGVRNLWELS